MHNAWLLHLGLHLPSFHVHLAGVRHMIELSLSSTRAFPPHITFISSIAATGLWPYPGPVPEASLENPDFAWPQGYAHAKYVSEKIVETAVKQRPELRASIVRSGQISGALATGSWSRREYIPNIIRLSMKHGVVPYDLTVSCICSSVSIQHS